MWSVMLRNSWTTLIGAAAGVAQYINANGMKLPTNKAESASFAAALFLAALGFAAKDATTGSKPGEPGR